MVDGRARGLRIDRFEFDLSAPVGFEHGGHVLKRWASALGIGMGIAERPFERPLNGSFGVSVRNGSARENAMTRAPRPHARKGLR
jgi:hypothetical protein